MTTFRRVVERSVHDGRIWTVVVAEFTDPEGASFHRDIVRSPGSVGVVPLLFDAEGLATVVLVEQYRPALDAEILEIPAGMRDVPGEPPADTGRRELVEEAGLSAGRIEHLVDMVTSPGMTDAVCSIFLATDCTPVAHDRQGPEERHMKVVHLPLDDALAMIDDGRIVDGKTVCGLLATERRIRRGDA
jgi:ADP-ribose pyrophosphatase